ncbi:uncharacterized protein PHACADRAFT_254348 [Phanerochaete carnosa HHB-10118-sp]|uniref:Uncharacterized protein n=1 Tax=Phanerochaete carnosa (strain HHB-10118-sp) TaxID=650164 RepID=K5X2D2_PHACS|nr:uncharacterized protein PHACADRAFT_254348 [Phanerochaete carnosa HHB-10118-sp]EKM56942.1 hypothetical protein PHACADRAFT_254348 [Phanerochaete carnosa HHB-10118-sp]
MSRPSSPTKQHADVSAIFIVRNQIALADGRVQVDSISHSSSTETPPASSTVSQRALQLPSNSRSRTARYPSHLGRGDPGRVFLHKRGTSRKYEALEDLLREAGYKETRIFSPEQEREEGRRDGRRGVGAVVGFLTGLMPGGNKIEEQQAVSSSEEVPKELPSPLSLAGKSTRSSSSTRPVVIEDLSENTPSSLGSPQRQYGRIPLGLSSSEHSPRFQSSASEYLRPLSQISAAQDYLRHIASSPNISKATRQNTPAHSNKPGGSSRLKFVHGEEPPPMPSNWLDSVTRAVLRSSASQAHIGSSSNANKRSQRGSRSSKENQPGFSSMRMKNKVRPVTGSLRAQTLEGTVTTCMVVCRSAPASRSSSRVGERLVPFADRGKARASSRPKYQKTRSSGSDVPTLARCRLENDAWDLEQTRTGDVAEAAVSDNDFSDDDDEGEVDLARILVPPKRQKSIRSLRQHLHRSDSIRALRGEFLRPMEPWTPQDDDVDPSRRSRGTGSKSRRGSIENGSYEHCYLHEPPSSARARRALPNTWSSAA